MVMWKRKCKITCTGKLLFFEQSITKCGKNGRGKERNMEKNILITGEDERQRYLAEILGEEKFKVTYVEDFLQMNREKIQKNQVLLFPMVVQQKILEHCMENLKQGQRVYGGMFPEEFVQHIKRKGVILFDYTKDDAIAIQNAVATAEGAIAEAIINSRVNLHGSQCLVIGFGRCGEILADKLKGLKCDVTVLVRSKEKMARAAAYGYHVKLCKNIKEQKLSKEKEVCFDYIFNTAPAMLVDRQFLQEQKSMVTIIDIASSPGGVDYDACKELEIMAKHCLSLPGKYAPMASAYILADAIISREQ